MSKEEKKIPVRVKLRRKHPANFMRLGKHRITNVFERYELSSSEIKELTSKGGKAWFISEKEFEESQAEKREKSRAGRKKKADKK